MQLAIQNLLDIRRAKFPKDAVTADCHNPANIRTLPKQQCKHSYCQTLVLTEHERGKLKPFLKKHGGHLGWTTIRGGYEIFVRFEVEPLESIRWKMLVEMSKLVLVEIAFLGIPVEDSVQLPEITSNRLGIDREYQVFIWSVG